MMEEARANRKSFLSSTHSYSLREPRLGKKVRPILPREAVLAGRGRCVLHLTAFEASLSLSFVAKFQFVSFPYFEMEKKTAKLRDFCLCAYSRKCAHKRSFAENGQLVVSEERGSKANLI